MYSFYRQIRSIGRARAWFSSKLDYVNWCDERYPPPPKTRHPGEIILSGAWSDLMPSFFSFGRFYCVFDMAIENDKKVRYHRKRRKKRKYREYQKRRGLL